MILNHWIDQLGDWNPQLFRELKGRLTAKYVAIMFLVSAVAQSLVYMSFKSALPYTPYYENQTNHYCLSSSPSAPYAQSACVLDAAGVMTINWPLWWTEMFLTLSLIGVFVLALGGTYLLIQDLTKEQKQGTLNFVTLSPQSATAIALGKILGVPIWIYGCIVAALPLHLWAGFRGGIPIHLILLFYGVVGACCLFFYSGAMLFALVSKGGPALKAWLGTGALFYTAGMSTMLLIHEHIHASNVADGLLLLNPIHLLVFLAHASPVADTLDWFQYNTLSDISFFRVPILQLAITAALTHFVIYGIGTYWFAQAFKRQFHNAHSTLISKKQSYILTALLTVFTLGFTVQEPYYGYSSDYNNWLVNFVSLAVLATFYLLMLIAALSPAYQSIQDWSRYQNRKPKECFFGERSPAFWAIALNALICFGSMAIAGLAVIEAQYRLMFALGFISQILIVVVLVGLGQYFLLARHKKRGAFATAIVLSSVVLPFLVLAMENANPQFSPAPWLWTITPLVAIKEASLSVMLATILGQLAVIGGLNQLIKKRIHRIGSSELRQLMDAKSLT